MNFKMKAAVAAIALTVSMSASAAMTNAGSGDSSLILTLLDNTNNISATFDLGLSYSTFQAPAVTAAGTSFSWDLANNANYSAAWNSFIATANLASTATNWAVYAADNLGNGAGSRGLITTYFSGTTMTQSQLATGMGNFDTYINANNPLGTHATVADGSSSAISGNAFAESASAYGATKKINNQGTLVVMNGFDKSMDVVTLKYVGTNQLAMASMTTYANQGGNAKFIMTSNGQLTYVAAVPEADTWAMLLAGLGLMGFIARRRTAA